MFLNKHRPKMATNLDLKLNVNQVRKLGLINVYLSLILSPLLNCPSPLNHPTNLKGFHDLYMSLCI